MKHFLSLLVFLCADLKADFIDDMARSVVKKKQWSYLLQSLEKDIELAHKEVLDYKKKLSLSSKDSKPLGQKIIILEARQRRLIQNFENIKDKIKDPASFSQIMSNLEEIVKLNNKFSKIKSKIKRTLKPHSSIKSAAKAYCNEINTITTSLAFEKAKIKDILGII